MKQATEENQGSHPLKRSALKNTAFLSTAKRISGAVKRVAPHPPTHFEADPSDILEPGSQGLWSDRVIATSYVSRTLL